MGNRWKSIGRTRRQLAKILTDYVRSIPGIDGTPRYPDSTVHPEDIHQMRLVAAHRKWNDAHCWEAFAKSGATGNLSRSLYSFNTMTECVRAGRVVPVGKDGEVSV